MYNLKNCKAFAFFVNIKVSLLISVISFTFLSVYLESILPNIGELLLDMYTLFSEVCYQCNVIVKYIVHFSVCSAVFTVNTCEHV